MGNETTIDAGTFSARTPRTSSAHAYLVVRAGEETRVIDLREGEGLIFWRGDDANVRIDDAKASREHVRDRKSVV